MSIVQVSHQAKVPATPFLGKRPWWRIVLLLLMLVLSIVLYVFLGRVAQPDAPTLTPFLLLWMLCFLPYFSACVFVFCTRPLHGRWRWIEMGIIFCGAVLFRALLLPLPPNLSHDSWRYLWDARVTLHGFSPYVYPPFAKVLQPLRDALILGNSRFRNVPSIYPPGAQAVFLLSYLLVPSNLFFFKGICIVFDMVTCGTLAILLARKGLDPRRVVIYAWCPLPIIEFALQGHMDVITLPFMLLAVLSTTSTRRGAGVLTGILIGVATLTKIYPIFLLLVVMRRKDWALLLACLGTIFVGYIPYLILGHGQVLGYFAMYSGEEGGNAGVVQVVTYALSFGEGYTRAAILQQHIVDFLVVIAMSLAVLVMRVFKRTSMEAATLVLMATVLAVSSHVFPWYTTALLPWIALLVGPLWTRRGGLSGKGLAVLMAWYFTCISLTQYFFNATSDWHVYYAYVYDVVMAGLGIALAIGLWKEIKHLHRLTLEGNTHGKAKHQ